MLTNLSSLVTIVLLLIAPIVYFVKQRQKEREAIQSETNERSRASKNLCIELNDTLDGLNAEKYSDLKKVTMGNSEFYFMNRALNHDFYDSLISSGKITYLNSDLLQHLQDTFQRIKDHNFYIRKIRDIEDNSIPGKDISSKTYRYYEKLHLNEEKLLEEIPKMKEKLEKEFKLNETISS